tara:strand:+ start:1539 stop:1943 length:405 start_codon:yes stop_codon:yes gene_type:complete
MESKMKTFLEYSSVKATDGEHIDEDGNLMDLSDDSVVEKLNAFVGSIGMKEYLVPEKAVNELRQKLMRVGIHFGDVQFTGESGDMSVPITKPIFGKDLDTPADEIVNEEETGRSINFVYEKLPTGTHKVMAQIS